MNPFLTAQGRWLLVSGVVFLVVGALARSPLTILLGEVCIVVLVVAFTMCLPSAMALDRRLVQLRMRPESDPASVERSGHVTGDDIVMELEVVNHSPVALHHFQATPFGARALAMEPIQAMAHLAVSHRAQASFNVRPGLSGRWSIQGFDVVTSDPLGLIRSKDYLPCVHAFECYPRAGRLRRHRPQARTLTNTSFDQAGQHARREISTGTEIRELRDYHGGDPLRNVAWKATVRSRRLISREFEQEVMLSSHLLLDISSSMRGGQWPGQKLEHALTYAAELAESMIRDRERVGLMTFDEKLYGYVAPGNTTRHLARIMHHLVGLNMVMDSDLTEFDDAETDQFLADYLLVQERLDFRKGDGLDSATGVNSALLRRWLHAVLPNEERHDGPILRTGVMRREESHARRFLQLRGVKVPYRVEARLGMKERGLVEALEHLISVTSGRELIIVMTDLCGIMNIELLSRGIKLAKIKGHRLHFVVSFTPDYHEPSNSDSDRYRVVRELFTIAEAEERMKTVRRLQSLGVTVEFLNPTGAPPKTAAP